MTINYTCALRSQFFDITELAARPDDMLKQSRSLSDGLLFIDGSHIVALVEWEEGCHWLRHPTDYIDYRDKLIVPGFVDTHLHYPQTEMVGAWGEQLLEWLQTYTFPTESKYADSDYAAAMSVFFLNQLLANGTTTALVFGTVHPESVDALFRAASHLEMRLIAGKVMMDRNAPPYLIETPEQSYQQTRDLILRWHNKGRINYALTPRFAPTSSPELMRAVEQLRQEFPDVWLHTHLSENTDEVAWVKALWPEHSSYLGVYHHYQMTGRRSVFAHAIHLEACEWECLRETDSSIAFCPTSNLFLGSGLFPLHTCLDHGVRVGMVRISVQVRPLICCRRSEKPTRSRSCKGANSMPVRLFIMRRSVARTPSISIVTSATLCRAKRLTSWSWIWPSAHCKKCVWRAAMISTKSCFY